jgi:5-methyltetrahydrofolate--homocysteine methyltransferase
MTTLIETLLAADIPIIADGAMGTMLFGLGLDQGASPETWNVQYPARVRSLHQDYINAGSQVILTNTFGGNPIRLALRELSNQTHKLNLHAAQIARHVADDTHHTVLVAGDIGPTGRILEPLGDLSFDLALSAFKEQAEALVAGGVDVLWIESMSDLREVEAAVAGIRRCVPGFPLVITMTFDTHGRTMFGVTPEQALAELKRYQPVALGANCGAGIEEMVQVIQKMHHADPDVRLVAKANAGVPRIENDEPVYDATPVMMGQYALHVRRFGASIIGTCCGSTPDHIQGIATALLGDDQTC